MTEYLTQNPPGGIIMNNISARTYVWEFHNAVNKRIGKRVLPFHEAMALYAPPPEIRHPPVGDGRRRAQPGPMRTFALQMGHRGHN